MLIERSKSGLREKGFTLAELLVALTVSSIVLGAVGTLAFAMGTANKSLDDASEAQTYSRFSTLVLRDTLRYGRQAFRTPDGYIAIWKADDKDNPNGRINGSELIFFRVVVEVDAPDLQLHEFAFKDTSVVPDPNFTIAQIENGTAYNELAQLVLTTNDKDIVEDRTTLKLSRGDLKSSYCSEVLFTISDPPANKYLNLTYKLTENGVTTKYQVNTRLMCSADNLIDYTAGQIVGDDD